MEEAMQAAAETDAKEVFVIGGGEIFKQVLPQANKVYLTRVHATLEGDAFFPELPQQEWKLLTQLDFTADAKHKYGYSFQVWQRNS
jgi:dihydrofolate reductase